MKRLDQILSSLFCTERLIPRLMRPGCLQVHTATPVLPPPGTTAPSCLDANAHSWHTVCKSCRKHPSSTKDHEGLAPGSSALAQSVQLLSQFSHLVSSVAQSVQSLSHVWVFATPWTAAHQASLSITNSWSLLKFMSIKLVMPSKHLILCLPLLLLFSIFPSIKVYSNESALRIRWPKYWNFSFSISPSNEYSALISFMIDWLDLLAVQGTLKNLL